MIFVKEKHRNEIFTFAICKFFPKISYFKTYFIVESEGYASLQLSRKNSELLHFGQATWGNILKTLWCCACEFCFEAKNTTIQIQSNTTADFLFGKFEFRNFTVYATRRQARLDI